MNLSAIRWFPKKPNKIKVLKFSEHLLLFFDVFRNQQFDLSNHFSKSIYSSYIIIVMLSVYTITSATYFVNNYDLELSEWMLSLMQSIAIAFQITAVMIFSRCMKTIKYLHDKLQAIVDSGN